MKTLFAISMTVLALTGCDDVSMRQASCMEQVRMSYCEPYYDRSSGGTKYDCTKILAVNKAVYDSAVMACIETNKAK